MFSVGILKLHTKTSKQLCVVQSVYPKIEKNAARFVLAHSIRPSDKV